MNEVKQDEPEYVIVARSLDDEAERIELPTEQDNTLGLQTLIGAFPGAHGLKYKNPLTGVFRALLIDTAGEKFRPPSDGWSNKVFVVLSQSQQSEHEKTKNSNQMKKSDQNAKRRKLMVESDDADSCDSDTEPFGKSHSENSIKRQQGTVKQKRMMGNNGSGGKGTDEAADEEIPTKIVDLLVLSLPFELTEVELRNHFETYGKVVHCEVCLSEIERALFLGEVQIVPFQIKTQKDSTTSRGFGFVQMGDLESQQKVLKKKIHSIGGRECEVKVPFTKNALSSKVFIGKIKEGTTTMELRRLFSEEARKIDSDARITDVYIPKPFRSFAFVTFSSPTVAKEMIRKAQFTLGDTQIYVASAHSTRPQQQQQDGSSQLQQFQQNRSNSYQALSTVPYQATGPPQPRNLVTADEMFYNTDWCLGAGNDRRSNAANAVTGLNPIRVAGPMFLGSAYQANANPPPHLPAYTGTPPPAAAGNQMLNQLETLNLNNRGIGHEVVNAIKAIFSVAQTATGQAQQQQQQVPQHSYQSLSPPPTNSGSSPSRVYVPPPQSSSHYQGRRNARGESTNSANSSGGWRQV